MRAVFALLFFSVTGCALAPDKTASALVFAPPFEDPRPVATALSKRQIDELAQALLAVRFPQPAGTIQKMMPAHIVGAMEFVGDVLPNQSGLLAVYTIRFQLDGEYDLILVQEHYSQGIIDRRAEMKHASSKRPNQSPEPTRMSVTPAADAPVAPATRVAHL